MTSPDQYDGWLTADDAAAIVIREPLVPVEGPDGVFFPATYAASEDKTFPGGYNIDPPAGEKNVCLVDSVGSQANRIEPIFSKPGYAELVPQVVIEAGEKKVNLLEAGHRAGDAIVRCTPLQKTLHDAFKAVLDGDASPMAKVAPTSLVFGAWDSRDTQAKLPRLIASTIRAFDVQRLTRSAVYLPTLDYVDAGLVPEELDSGKGKDNPLAQRGYKHNPASAAHGGIIARGGIRRDVTLSLAALRLLSAADGPEQTLGLRRYVLGLALVALTAPAQTYLRQGCNLVPDGDNPRTLTLVGADGSRDDGLTLEHEACRDFARLAAEAFGVGESRNENFDPELARKDLTGDGDAKQTRRTNAKGSARKSNQ
jgi:CRISPR-associated protein Csb1